MDQERLEQLKAVTPSVSQARRIATQAEELKCEEFRALIEAYRRRVRETHREGEVD